MGLISSPSEGEKQIHVTGLLFVHLINSTPNLKTHKIMD